eukprot:460463-Pyramimonas_sp.AAC.1
MAARTRHAWRVARRGELARGGHPCPLQRAGPAGADPPAPHGGDARERSAVDGVPLQQLQPNQGERGRAGRAAGGAGGARAP